jgi:hypothetical protein
LKDFYDLPISMAQLEASNENTDVICAGPVYPITIATSGAHPNSNGYRWYGEMLGKVYYKTQILKEDFKPLQPKAFFGTNNPNEVKIQFLVPHLPLVLDENLIAKKAGYGFEVKLNNAKVTVSNVTLDGDCVVLTLESNITSTDVIEISYAGIDLQSGNLRDSDPYQALSVYEDLDRNTGGVFFYPRKDNASLRPRQEPKDANGQVIYNQPYPLYNFCVAFYKRLTAEELSDRTGIQIKNKKPLAIYLDHTDLIIENRDASIEKVEIFNMSGCKVKEYTKNHNVYPLSSLPDGMYITKVSTDNAIYMVKMVK